MKKLKTPWVQGLSSLVACNKKHNVLTREESRHSIYMYQIIRSCAVNTWQKRHWTPASGSQSGCDPGQVSPWGLGSALCTVKSCSRSQLTLNSHESTRLGHDGGGSQASGSSRFSSVAPRGDVSHHSLLTEPKREHPWEIMDFLHYFKRTLP